MERHHSCINTLAVIRYFQDNAPHLTYELLQNLGSEIDCLTDVQEFLSDPNNWVSGQVLINMYSNARRLLGEDVVFKIGFESVIKRRLGYIEKIFILALGNPGKALKKVQAINDKFNCNKTINTLDIQSTSAVLQLHWFKDVPLSKDFCLINKGIYTAVPVIWGLPPAQVEETQCYFEGAPYCEYKLTWEKKLSVMAYLRRAILPWQVLERSIGELERDKELIREKYEEVHRLNVQLKNRIDQLLSLQEVSSAILSTLDTNRLFDLILKLLIKVARLDRAAIFVVDEGKEVLSLVHAVGIEPDDFREVQNYTVPLSKTDNIIARAAQRKEPLFVKDVEKSLLNKNNPLIRKFKPKSLILVPLAAKGRLLGVLVGDQTHKGNGDESPDPEFLTSFANQIAMSLNNSNLHTRLGESEKKYRELIENAHDGIWLLDEEDRLLLGNKRLSDIFTNDWRPGESIYRCVGEENESILKTLIDQNRSGLVSQGMMDLQGANGRISALISSVPLIEEGQAKGSFAIITDVSEMKKLEKQLYQAQKMECIGTMAGGIAHDFNNILTSILGYTALLKRQVPDISSLKYLDIIEKSSQRAADLVQKILSFSRGGQIQKVLPLDVNEVVSETVQLLSNVIDKRIEINFEPEATWSTILGDPTQLQQAILNICINARDAMPQGGTLRIKTVNCRVPAAHGEGIPAGEEGVADHVKITIADTGCGIDEENLNRIFDPFFTTKPLGKGTGLGLAIVHGTIKTMRGIVNVESRIGKGTTFELTFPAIKQAIMQKETSASAVTGGRGTILLVDDEEYLRQLGEKILSLNGYRVLLAKDGLEALEIYKSAREEISLVILDLIMPNFSGEDTYKKLKEINPKVPVVICTGYGVDAEAMRKLEREVQGLIKKPFAFDELLQIVQSSIESAAN